RGPVTSVLRHYKLRRDDSLDVLRESLTWIAIAWLPLALAVAVATLLRRPIDPLVFDPSVHVRLLAALPLCILGRRIMGVRCDKALVSREELGTVETDGRAPLARATATFVHVVRSRYLETLALLVALTASVTFPLVAPAGFVGHWYVYVSLPVFRFVL